MAKQPALSAAELEHLLHLADNVVTWTTQATIKPDAAGAPHLREARQRYYRERINSYAQIRPLTFRDTGGCTCNVCGPDGPDFENCMYHYAARLQPDNHHIPWNCPTFYDGCNCEQPSLPDNQS